MKIGVLLVEDEASIAKALKAGLEFEGYAFFWAHSLSKAQELLMRHKHEIHLMLLDVMLPDGEGFDAYAIFKNIHPKLRILFTTARIESGDKVKGLRLGADDYITKPYDLDEIILRLERIKPLIKLQEDISVFEFKNGKMDFQNYRVWNKKGTEFSLGNKENHVLKFLVVHAGKTLSREEIYNACWENGETGSLRTIDNFILNYRKIFEDTPSEPMHFLSVRGVGYRFEP
ncbi:MAG: response regulator transcription factor [Bacteroidia bacterium]|nr:response regulator transcription factor [Bacteroidia bacterium]